MKKSELPDYADRKVARISFYSILIVHLRLRKSNPLVSVLSAFIILSVHHHLHPLVPLIPRFTK